MDDDPRRDRPVGARRPVENAPRRVHAYRDLDIHRPRPLHDGYPGPRHQALLAAQHHNTARRGLGDLHHQDAHGGDHSNNGRRPSLDRVRCQRSDCNEHRDRRCRRGSTNLDADRCGDFGQPVVLTLGSTDEVGGSGVASSDVWASQDGAAFTLVGDAIAAARSRSPEASDRTIALSFVPKMRQVTEVPSPRPQQR